VAVLVAAAYGRQGGMSSPRCCSGDAMLLETGDTEASEANNRPNFNWHSAAPNECQPWPTAAPVEWSVWGRSPGLGEEACLGDAGLGDAGLGLGDARGAWRTVPLHT
jgi:hypothetical protein